jgi:hypothetical protein
VITGEEKGGRLRLADAWEEFKQNCLKNCDATDEEIEDERMTFYNGALMAALAYEESPSKLQEDLDAFNREMEKEEKEEKRKPTFRKMDDDDVDKPN